MKKKVLAYPFKIILFEAKFDFIISYFFVISLLSQICKNFEIYISLYVDLMRYAIPEVHVKRKLIFL